MNLDYTLTTMQERTDLVSQIIKKTPQEKLTPAYLTYLSDYIFKAKDKSDRRFLTDNRLITVNARETSFEGLCGKLENGENGIYNMLNTLGKAVILTPKKSITAADVAEVPGLRDLMDAIAVTESQLKSARGKRRYNLKKQLKEMHQDKYVLKNEYRKPIYCMNAVKSINTVNLSEKITIDENGEPISTGLINFFDPAHISAILCNYSALKESAWGNFKGDAYFMMEDFDALVDSALKDYPIYQDIVLYKIDGRQNTEIQDLLERDHQVRHSIEYISSLWRKKIPKLIAQAAKEQYLNYYYTQIEYGKWKRCSCCGQIKLAHSYYFSKNSTSKDGWYSLCKECRNRKNKKKKGGNA